MVKTEYYRHTDRAYCDLPHLHCLVKIDESSAAAGGVLKLHEEGSQPGWALDYPQEYGQHPRCSIAVSVVVHYQNVTLETAANLTDDGFFALEQCLRIQERLSNKHDRQWERLSRWNSACLRSGVDCFWPLGSYET